MKQVSVNNLAECTAQEVFDFVANHLLTQNEKSEDEKGWCLYRSFKPGKSLACAAGCLIPDEMFKDSLNYQPWGISYGRTYPTHLTLIRGLQSIHDGTRTDEWLQMLKHSAEAAGLSAKILEQFA